VASPAVGGFVLLITGSQLSTAPEVTVSGEPCAVRWLSSDHGSVACVAPPRRVDVPTVVVVRSGSMSSNAAAFAYDPPVVTAVSPRAFTAVRVSGVLPRITVTGVNFGVLRADIRSRHRVFVGDAACVSVLWRSDSELVCTFDGEVNAGWHAVSVWVLDDVSRGNSSVVNDTATSIRALCPEGMFGSDGERCMACPEGAVCAGGDAELVAAQGYYRTAHLVFEACAPKSACLGGVNSTCHRDYEGVRCATCRSGAYR
jgi:hypothetical protein